MLSGAWVKRQGRSTLSITVDVFWAVGGSELSVSAIPTIPWFIPILTTCLLSCILSGTDIRLGCTCLSPILGSSVLSHSGLLYKKSSKLSTIFPFYVCTDWVLEKEIDFFIFLGFDSKSVNKPTPCIRVAQGSICLIGNRHPCPQLSLKTNGYCTPREQLFHGNMTGFLA